MRMRKAVFKHSRAKIVYVMNGWNRFKASRDFMEWFEGLAGDACHGGHGARGCGVPEGITAGQSRIPYGQIETQGVYLYKCVND